MMFAIVCSKASGTEALKAIRYAALRTLWEDTELWNCLQCYHLLHRGSHIEDGRITFRTFGS